MLKKHREFTRNPKNDYNTSRACALCQQEVARYRTGQPEEGYQTGAPLVVCLDPECRHPRPRRVIRQSRDWAACAGPYA